MAEMPDVVTLTTISSNWGNQIRDRTVQRYSSVANRTSEHGSPSEGDLSYLEDSNSVWVYDGSSWLLLGPNLEVDGSTEVAAEQQFTASLAVYATVNLTIPTTWGGWKCEAYATFGYTVTTGALARFRVAIDGTDQQEQIINSTVSTEVGSGAIGGRRTGLTTTGSRAITLRARNDNYPTANAKIYGTYLFARATRTS